MCSSQTTCLTCRIWQIWEAIFYKNTKHHRKVNDWTITMNGGQIACQLGSRVDSAVSRVTVKVWLSSAVPLTTQQQTRETFQEAVGVSCLDPDALFSYHAICLSVLSSIIPPSLLCLLPRARTTTFITDKQPPTLDCMWHRKMMRNKTS